MEIAASLLEVTGDEREPPSAGPRPPHAFVCVGEVLCKRKGFSALVKNEDKEMSLTHPPPPGLQSNQKSSPDAEGDQRAAINKLIWKYANRGSHRATVNYRKHKASNHQEQVDVQLCLNND